MQAAASGFEAQRATATATAAAADEAVVIANKAIADAQATEGLLEQVPLLKLLPPGYREAIALVGSVGLGLYRSRKLRAAADSIIRSIEVVRKSDPEVDQLLSRNAVILRSKQTATAQKLVDDVQAKRRPLIAA